jgi:hypothetical protein
MIRKRRESPTWRAGRWAEQKHATATRIAGAVASLRQAGDKITYGSICRSVQSLYGISISANTIKRNDAAFEIYSANRSSRRFAPAKEQALQKLVWDATGANRKRLGPKIARLRRMRKDSLIAMLLQLQDTSDCQKTNETNLRDEILRLLTTSVRQRNGHQGKGIAAEGM